MTPAATREREAPGTPVPQVPRYPEKGTKPVPSWVPGPTLSSSAFAHCRALPDLCSEHYSGSHLGLGSSPGGDCVHITGGGGAEALGSSSPRHPALSLLQRPPFTVLHRWPLRNPHPQDLCLRARGTHRGRHRHHPLCFHPPEHRAQVGGEAASPACTLGQSPKKPPLSFPPLPPPSLLSPFFLFPPMSSLLLSFGSLPPRPLPPSPALFFGLRSLIPAPNSKSLIASPQAPEEEAYLPQLPALLDG